MERKAQRFMEIADEMSAVIGRMNPGDRVMMADEIRAAYSVSVVTASRVLRELQLRGLIQSKPGVGSVVSSVKRQGFVICVVPPVELCHSPHFLLFHAGISMGCGADYQHYNVILVKEECLRRDVESLESRSSTVAGVIFFRYAEQYGRHAAFLRERHIPGVFFGSSAFGVGLDCDCGCFYSEEEIVGIALEHLLERGHRRIGCIYMEDVALDVSRHGFYRAFMKKHRLSWKPEYSFAAGKGLWFDLMMESAEGRRRLRHYLSGISALLMLHDGQAAVAIQHMAELGLRIPEDISMVSIDDRYLCDYLRPRLDSVSFDVYGNAVRCLEMLDRFKERGGKRCCTVVDVGLQIRDSVCYCAGEVVVAENETTEENGRDG